MLIRAILGYLLSFIIVGAVGAQGHMSDREALRYFAQADNYISAALSPGGGLFAYWRMAGSTPEVVIGTTAQHEAAESPGYPFQPSLFNWMHWLDEKRLIISITLIEADAQTLVEPGRSRRRLDAPTGLKRRLYLADAGSRTITSVIDYPLNHRTANGADAFLSRLPEEPDQFLLAFSPKGDDHPGVYRINAITGEALEVAAPEPPFMQWSVDNAGIPRLASGWDDDRLRIKVRPDAANDWRDISDHPLFKDGRFGIIGYADNGKDLYVRSSIGKGRGVIYRYDTQRQSVRGKVFEHPRFDAGTLLFADGGRTVLGATYVDDQPQIEIFDQGFKAAYQQVKEALAPENFVVSGISDNGALWLVQSLPVDRPGSLFLFNSEKKTLHKLMDRQSHLPSPAASATTPVSYFSRDGLEIPAYLTLPRTRATGDIIPDDTVPVIVMPHGGPWVRDMLIYDPWVQFFASRGFAVLQPNFRGSTGFGSAFEGYGHGQWGKAMQQDLEDGALWLTSRGIADPSRMCIFGASYGGYAALIAATADKTVFKCAVAVAPVTDIPLWVATISNTKAERKAFTHRIAGATRSKTLKAISPLHRAKKASLPVLIIHGTADIRVSPMHSREMVAALEKAKRPHKAIWLPGGSHFILQGEHRKAVLEAALNFLRQNIGNH